jgi:hypothetical protein
MSWWSACVHAHASVCVCVCAAASSGADLVDEEGRDRPLVAAAKGGHLAVVQLLIERGARVDDAEGQSGKTVGGVGCVWGVVVERRGCYYRT